MENLHSNYISSQTQSLSELGKELDHFASHGITTENYSEIETRIENIKKRIIDNFDAKNAENRKTPINFTCINLKIIEQQKNLFTTDADGFLIPFQPKNKEDLDKLDKLNNLLNKIEYSLNLIINSQLEATRAFHDKAFRQFLNVWNFILDTSSETTYDEMDNQCREKFDKISLCWRTYALKNEGDYLIRKTYSKKTTFKEENYVLSIKNDKKILNYPFVLDKQSNQWKLKSSSWSILQVMIRFLLQKHSKFTPIAPPCEQEIIDFGIYAIRQYNIELLKGMVSVEEK